MKIDNGSRPKALARWVSRIFGFAVLACVIMFVAHYRQEKALTQLLHQARPTWLLLAFLLQLGTYTTEARIWQVIIKRANMSRQLRSYVGMGLTKLFMDQAVPRGPEQHVARRPGP